MNMRDPANFYAKYLHDFDKPDGPLLLEFPWDTTSTLWTHLNLAYLVRLGLKLGFEPGCEEGRLDLYWAAKVPKSDKYELVVEEEWVAEKDDEDLNKLISAHAYLKVFITALRREVWTSRGFYNTIVTNPVSTGVQKGDSYLVMNISPMPGEEKCDTFQVDGFIVNPSGIRQDLPPSKPFPCKRLH